MIRPMLKACRPCGMPQPQKTSSTEAGSTSGLRSSSWSTTKAPISSGRSWASEPLKARPIGRADGVDDHCFGHCGYLLESFGEGRRW